MTEPIDDWNAGGSPLGRELLRTGRVERAPASTRRRAELAMLAGAGAALTSGAGASASWLKAGALRGGSKWLLVSGLLVGGSGILAWKLSANEGASASAPKQGPTQMRESRPVPVASAPESESITRQSEQRAEAARVGGAPARSPEHAQRAPVPVGSATDVPGDGRLAREVADLGQARAELARGAPEQALRILDPAGGNFRILALEAEVLRAEALAASGQRPAARALAQQLLQKHPTGPYAQRLRALAE